MANEPPGARAASPALVQLLEESADRLRAISEHSEDQIVEVDDRGRFLFVSRRAADTLGIDPQAAIGQPMRGFDVHPDDRRDDYYERFIAGLDEGRTTARFEARMRQPDGTWHWLESRFSAYRARDGRWRTIVIARDVTDRVTAELGLRESEERYRVLTGAAEEIVAELDRTGNVLYASPATQKVLGSTGDDAPDYSLQRVHPDDHAQIAETFRQATRHGKRGFSGAYRMRHADGSWRWLETEAIPFERQNGERRVLLLGRDVTERRNLEERIQQAQKLEGLGVLAGGIAHDFNNLLTPILGDASLALSDLPEDSPARTALQRIQRAARRAATLTHQMLAYAGQRPLQMEALDLSTLVAEMMQLLESSVARKAQLDARLATGLPAVQGDAAQLCQVVMNVIANAAEAVEGHGSRIEIRTGTLARAPVLEGIWQGDPLPDGPVVYFEVRDDGCGMDEGTLSRIFDPFFTTKFTGRGLGLAAALGIVRGHGGALEIDSTPGVGTRFRVLLPASGNVEPAHPDAGSLRLPWRGAGTVLVVDDDEGVREMVHETLSRAGLRVVSASTGEAGIEVLRAGTPAIDLIVLDRTLPSIAGADLYESLRKVDPSARVLLISGYSGESSMATLAEPGVTDFLQKPFLPDALLDKARALMER